MPSHLLANSAFSGMDIYRSGRSTRSKPLLPPPTVPIVQSITPLDAARRSSLALPDALLPVASSPPIPERSTSLSGDILLNSPTTDESASDQRHHATSIDMEGEARRGPVQMANVVNWARPFVTEAEEQFLFGQSNQRQRRMGKAAPISPYIDSPSSASSDEESLPVTPGSASFFPSLPFVQATTLAGLGMGVDITKTERRVQWSQKQEVARRIHSLPSGAPATLEELRRLKSAAQELEDEVRGRSIVPMSESPMIEHQDLPVVPITVLRGRRIRRKAVPTIMTLDADIITVPEPRVFTLEVAPLPDTPRSTGSSSNSFSSGPFDLSAGCSSSDNDSSPPQTPPHAMVAFSPPMTPMRASSSESSGLRRSPGVVAGLSVSPSLPLYVPSIHGEIDGWWSSSDDDVDEHGDEADIDTESDTSPFPVSQPTFASQAIASTPIRRAPGFHMRSVSDDTAAPFQQARKNFYGNKTAFMSSFFGKPSTSSTSEAAASPKRSSTTKATPPSSWGKHASVGVSSVSSTSSSSSSSATPTPKAGRRESLQFLSPRVVSPADCAGGEAWAPRPPADSPKKSFYANNKAFRSVMDLGSMRKAGKDKDREEKSMAPHESATHKRGISKFFRKLVI